MIAEQTMRSHRLYTSLSYAGALLGLALAALFGVLASQSAIRFHEFQWLSDAALTLVFAAPALLALMATTRRPVLLLAAAAASLPVSVISMAGITLVFLVPAVLYLIAYMRRPRPVPSRVSTSAVVLATALLVTASAGVAVLGGKTVCRDEATAASEYKDPLFGVVTVEGVVVDGGAFSGRGTGACSSSVLFPTQSVVSILLLAGAFLMAGLGSRPAETYQ